MFETKSIVSQFPIVVAEHLFVQVAEQVKGFHANVSSLEAALEKTPEVFETVGVNLPVNVPFRVVNDLVLEPLLLESLIGHESIGVDRASRFDVSADIGLEQVLLAIADNRSANLSAAFQDSHNCNLVLGTSLS